MFQNLKVAASQNTVFLSLLILVSCSLSCSSGRPTKHREFQDRDTLSNLYFSFYRTQKLAFQNKLATSAFHLFRGSAPTFLESISSERRFQGLFSGLPPTVVHGDFHIQQMAQIDGENILDDFDTGDWGPFWIDLVRIEASAMIIAQMQSLRLYAPGACTQSYFEYLEARPPTLLSTPILENSVAGSEVIAQVAPKAWTDSDAKLVPKNLQTDFGLWVSKNRTGFSLEGLRTLKGGVGSFNSEKYLALLRDAQNNEIYVELKSQESEPLKKLRRSPKSGQLKACERYKLATRTFRSVWEPQCWDYQGKSFAIIDWKSRFRSPDPEDFSSEVGLSQHLAWMCARLFEGHRMRWTSADIAAVRFASKSNPLLKERILMLARDEAHLLLDAQRMILETRIKSAQP